MATLRSSGSETGGSPRRPCLKAGASGNCLLRENKITPQQLQEALEEQKRQGGSIKIGAILVKKGFITEETLTFFLSKHFGLPQIHLADITFDPALTEVIPAHVARKYEILPIGREGPNLKIAISDPSNIFALDDLKFLTGSNIRLFSGVR